MATTKEFLDKTGLDTLWSRIKTAVSEVDSKADANATAIASVQSEVASNKNLYSARFEENTDGSDTYTMVLPMVAGVAETTQTITM